MQGIDDKRKIGITEKISRDKNENSNIARWYKQLSQIRTQTQRCISTIQTAGQIMSGKIQSRQILPDDSNPDENYKSANMAKTRMYDVFSGIIKTYYENDPDINILDFNKLIKENGAKTDNIGREIDLTDYDNSEYNKLYHENVHLNYRKGIPFLTF